MACNFLHNAEGKVIAIFCGSPWGIGVYYHCHDPECFCDGESVYGFPPKVMNPEDFTLDEESCTENEIAAWKADLTAWRARDPA